MDLNTVLDQAKTAALAKAQEIWERDGKQDCGSCGGAVLLLDGRSKLAKLAIEKGIAFANSGDIYVRTLIPEGVRSQNADIFQDSQRAFKNVLEANGYGSAIKKFWTYID